MSRSVLQPGERRSIAPGAAPVSEPKGGKPAGAPPAQAMEISIPDVRPVPADRLERQRQNMERFRAEAKARKAAEKARGKGGRAGGRAAAVDAAAVPVRPPPIQTELYFQHVQYVQYGSILYLTF